MSIKILNWDFILKQILIKIYLFYEEKIEMTLIITLKN